MPDPLPLEDYINIDSDAPSMDTALVEEQLLPQPTNTEQPEDDEEEETPDPDIKSIPDALVLFEKLKEFCAFTDNVDMLTSLSAMQDNLVKKHTTDSIKKRTQTSITQFLQKQ